MLVTVRLLQESYRKFNKLQTSQFSTLKNYVENYKSYDNNWYKNLVNSKNQTLKNILTVITLITAAVKSAINAENNV